jgi:colanic acid biosynthesis glycosyl transferase WcaI
MRILIITQYFWPEYFRINDLAKKLSKNYEIEVLTGYPNYPHGEIYKEFLSNKEKFGKLQKIKIHRVPIYPRKSGNQLQLILNYISYLLSAVLFGYFLLRKKKYDLILTFASSPITVALVGIFFSKIKNSKHVIWVLDLWPDVLRDLNIIKFNSFLYKFFFTIVDYIYRKVDLILCQSLSFKKKINENYNRKYEKKLIYFPSWPEDVKFQLKDNNHFFDKNYINIFFAGNIGESQNFDLIVKVFKSLQDKKIRVRLYVAGEGRGFKKLQLQISNNLINNIILLGWKDFDELQSYFLNADYLLISLKYLETFNSTIPGKFQTYLKYKRPILGFIGGETNFIINKYKIGKAFNYSDDENFINNIELFFQNKCEIEYNNFDKLLNIYSKEKRLNKLICNLKNLFNSTDNSAIKVITSASHINYEKNFIISAFNLAFLGYYSKGDICENKNLYLWPDGYFRKRFLPSSVNKFPGRFLLKNLYLNNTSIKNLVVIGNLSNNSKIFLEKLLNIEVLHVQLPIGNLEDFKKYIPVFKKDQICIITLPTPKQEILANYISENQIFFRIFCFGAAVAMASGDEKSLPDKYLNLFLAEALWRLQFEPRRRIKRLIETFTYYFKGELVGKYKKLKFKVLNEKF